MFSLADQGGGSVIPDSVVLSSNINFTAYAVRRPSGAISFLLNNKDTITGVQLSLNMGTNVSEAEAIELTGPSLTSTNGYMIGGTQINTNGSWAGGVQSVIPATNGVVTIIVPPISAILLNPVLTSPQIIYSMAGNQLSLSWPTNYIGWLLQSNSVSLTAGNNWYTVPGTGGTNGFQVTIQPNLTDVFYRIVSP
jgi:hypothetical protein